MDLDQIKKQLKKQLEDSDRFEMSVGNVDSLSRIKANSVTDKIKKSLITEIVFSIFFIMVLVYVVFTTQFESIRIYFSTFIILVSFFVALLVYLYNKTIKLTASSLTVIQNLKALYGLLSEFVKRYFQFTMILIPVCLLFSGYLAYSDEQSHINSFSISAIKFENNHNTLVFFLFLLGLFIGGMYFFTKWYLKKLYGNHLEHLKEMIVQLES
jgi:hypothetical protein